MNMTSNEKHQRRKKEQTYPQMPLRASMFKLAACEGNMMQVNRAIQSQVILNGLGGETR